MRIDRDKIQRKLEDVIDEMFSDFYYHYELDDFSYSTALEKELNVAKEALIDVVVAYMQYQMEG